MSEGKCTNDFFPILIVSIFTAINTMTLETGVKISNFCLFRAILQTREALTLALVKKKHNVFCAIGVAPAAYAPEKNYLPHISSHFTFDALLLTVHELCNRLKFNAAKKKPESKINEICVESLLMMRESCGFHAPREGLYLY